MNVSLRVLRNFTALVTSTLLERAINFVLFLFIARFLGSAGLGEYSLAFSFLAIFETMSYLGQNFLVVREVARDRSQSARYLINSGVLVGMAAIVCAGAMWGAVRLLGYPSETIACISIMALVLIPDSLVAVPEAILQGWERMEFVTLFRFVSNLVGTGLSIVLLWHGAPLTVVFWVLAAQRTLLMLLYILFTHLSLPGMSWRPDGAFMRQLARLSLTFTAISVLGALVKNVDMLFLRRLHGAEITGFYAAAAKPIRLISIAAPVLMTAIFPSLSEAYARAPVRFDRIVHTTLRGLALVIPFTSLMFVLAAEPLVRLMYGPSYEASVRSLQILAWTLAPVFGGAILFRSLLASNREHISLSVAAVNATVNVGLNLLLTPLYGGLGASIAVLATAIAGFAQNYWYVRRLVSLNLWRMVGRPLLSCAAAGGVHLLLSGVPVLLRLVLACATYLAGLLISGALSAREWQALRTLWHDVRKHLPATRTA